MDCLAVNSTNISLITSQDTSLNLAGVKDYGV